MTTPTYTYTYNPSTVPLDQIRLWISDTILYFDPTRNANVMQLADQEINAYIAECTSLYEAAASCCEQIASTYAGKHQYSKSLGDVSVSENFNKQHMNYLEIAATIRQRHSRYVSFAPDYVPESMESFATTGKIPQTTEFSIGQFDDTLSDGLGTDSLSGG